MTGSCHKYPPVLCAFPAKMHKIGAFSSKLKLLCGLFLPEPVGFVRDCSIRWQRKRIRRIANR